MTVSKCLNPDPDKRFDSVDSLKISICSNNLRKFAFPIVTVVTIITLLLVVFIRPTANENNEREILLPQNNITTIYYNCYNKIDKMLKPYSNNSLTSSDCTKLIDKAESIIDEAYDGYDNAIEKEKSLEWARKRINQLIKK